MIKSRQLTLQKMPEINERFVKLSSRVPFPSEIQLGEDLVVVVGDQNYIFNCVKSEDRDLQDGTIDRIFTLKSVAE